MAKGSITDEEIALIKAMLARGMKNKNIQFFFNRPDRAVNSGRITGIKDGSYANSSQISLATDGDLDAFLAKQEAKRTFATMTVPIVGKVPSPVYGPVDAETLAAMFYQDLNGIWRFRFGETDQHECKENFGFKHSGAWLRAIAALANNRGGYIFFGVHDKDTSPIDGLDKSYAIQGLQGDNEFLKADPADFSKRIKSALDPTPQIEIATIQIDGKTIGVVYIRQHASRPVIASNTVGEKLREGEIYYRYVGQSDRIKYGDLRALLDSRDAQARRDILPMVERLLSLGPGKALITNLENGLLEDGKRQIVIDPMLVEQIKFIKEGEFSEKDGAPTLKLIGNVSALTGSAAEPQKLVRDSVLEEDIIRNFFAQNSVDRPEAYVRQCLDLQRKWLPIFYYVKQSGKSAVDLAGIIAAEKTAHKTRQAEIVKRLRGTLSTKTKPSSNAVRHMAAQIATGHLPTLDNAKSASTFASAIVTLDKCTTPVAEILKALETARELLEAKDASLLGQVFKAACRLDEIYFGT